MLLHLKKYRFRYQTNLVSEKVSDSVLFRFLVSSHTDQKNYLSTFSLILLVAKTCTIYLGLVVATLCSQLHQLPSAGAVYRLPRKGRRHHPPDLNHFDDEDKHSSNYQNTAVRPVLLLLLRHSRGTLTYLRNEKSYRRSAGVKTTGFLWPFLPFLIPPTWLK